MHIARFFTLRRSVNPRQRFSCPSRRVPWRSGPGRRPASRLLLMPANARKLAACFSQSAWSFSRFRAPPLSPSRRESTKVLRRAGTDLLVVDRHGIFNPGISLRFQDEFSGHGKQIWVIGVGSPLFTTGSNRYTFFGFWEPPPEVQALESVGSVAVRTQSPVSLTAVLDTGE